MEIKDGGIVVINGDNIEAGGMKVVNQYGSSANKPQEEKLTEEQLRDKIERVRPFIENKRLWFPVCKYMMWRKMVAEGDFKTAVDILDRLFPEPKLGLDYKDLSKMNVDSFSKELSRWDPKNAPVSHTIFSKYYLIANQMFT